MSGEGEDFGTFAGSSNTDWNPSFGDFADASSSKPTENNSDFVFDEFADSDSKKNSDASLKIDDFEVVGQTSASGGTGNDHFDFDFASSDTKTNQHDADFSFDANPTADASDFNFDSDVAASQDMKSSDDFDKKASLDTSKSADQGVPDNTNVAASDFAFDSAAEDKAQPENNADEDDFAKVAHNDNDQAIPQSTAANDELDDKKLAADDFKFDDSGLKENTSSPIDQQAVENKDENGNEDSNDFDCNSNGNQQSFKLDDANTDLTDKMNDASDFKFDDQTPATSDLPQEDESKSEKEADFSFEAAPTHSTSSDDDIKPASDSVSKAEPVQDEDFNFDSNEKEKSKMDVKPAMEIQTSQDFQVEAGGTTDFDFNFDDNQADSAIQKKDDDFNFDEPVKVDSATQNKEGDFSFDEPAKEDDAKSPDMAKKENEEDESKAHDNFNFDEPAKVEDIKSTENEQDEAKNDEDFNFDEPTNVEDIKSTGKEQNETKNDDDFNFAEPTQVDSSTSTKQDDFNFAEPVKVEDTDNSPDLAKKENEEDESNKDDDFNFDEPAPVTDIKFPEDNKEDDAPKNDDDFNFDEPAKIEDIKFYDNTQTKSSNADDNMQADATDDITAENKKIDDVSFDEKQSVNPGTAEDKKDDFNFDDSTNVDSSDFAFDDQDSSKQTTEQNKGQDDDFTFDDSANVHSNDQKADTNDDFNFDENTKQESSKGADTEQDNFVFDSGNADDSDFNFEQSTDLEKSEISEDTIAVPESVTADFDFDKKESEDVAKTQTEDEFQFDDSTNQEDDSDFNFDQDDSQPSKKPESSKPDDAEFNFEEGKTNEEDFKFEDSTNDNKGDNDEWGFGGFDDNNDGGAEFDADFDDFNADQKDDDFSFEADFETTTNEPVAKPTQPEPTQAPSASGSSATMQFHAMSSSDLAKFISPITVLFVSKKSQFDRSSIPSVDANCLVPRSTDTNEACPSCAVKYASSQSQNSFSFCFSCGFVNRKENFSRNIPLTNTRHALLSDLQIQRSTILQAEKPGSMETFTPSSSVPVQFPSKQKTSAPASSSADDSIAVEQKPAVTNELFPTPPSQPAVKPAEQDQQTVPPVISAAESDFDFSENHKDSDFSFADNDFQTGADFAATTTPNVQPPMQDDWPAFTPSSSSKPKSSGLDDLFGDSTTPVATGPDPLHELMSKAKTSQVPVASTTEEGKEHDNDQSDVSAQDNNEENVTAEEPKDIDPDKFDDLISRFGPVKSPPVSQREVKPVVANKASDVSSPPKKSRNFADFTSSLEQKAFAEAGVLDRSNEDEDVLQRAKAASSEEQKPDEIKDEDDFAPAGGVIEPVSAEDTSALDNPTAAASIPSQSPQLNDTHESKKDAPDSDFVVQDSSFAGHDDFVSASSNTNTLDAEAPSQMTSNDFAAPTKKESSSQEEKISTPDAQDFSMGGFTGSDNPVSDMDFEASGFVGGGTNHDFDSEDFNSGFVGGIQTETSTKMDFTTSSKGDNLDFSDSAFVSSSNNNEIGSSDFASSDQFVSAGNDTNDADFDHAGFAGVDTATDTDFDQDGFANVQVGPSSSITPPSTTPTLTTTEPPVHNKYDLGTGFSVDSPTLMRVAGTDSELKKQHSSDFLFSNSPKKEPSNPIEELMRNASRTLSSECCDEEKLQLSESEQIEQLLANLPDHSFMLAKSLILPIKGLGGLNTI